MSVVDLDRLREFLQEHGEICRVFSGEVCDCLFCLVNEIDVKLVMRVSTADSRALEFAKAQPFAWRVP